MGMTDEEYYQQEFEESEYFRKQLEQEVKDRKSSFTEGAEKIHEYLPINRNPQENQYILHLWDAFITLNGLADDGVGFSIMPYHLLFMLSLQYKVLRILGRHRKECELVFKTAGGRNKVDLMKKDRNVYTIAFLNESTFQNILKIIFP